MKKSIVLVLLLLACLLVSCHNHTFAESWTSDENNHWHSATCQHDLKKDEAPHSLDKGVCTVCGRNVVSGTWVIDVDKVAEEYEKSMREALADYLNDPSIKDTVEMYIDAGIQEYRANMATIVIELYDDGEALFKYSDEKEFGTYRITHQGSLFMTVDGDEAEIGLFASDYSSLVFILGDMELLMYKK